MKLYILHHAGGNSYYYNAWINSINSKIDILLLDMPGHGRREKEPIFIDYYEIFEDLKRLILKTAKSNEQIAIFGHSMGGLLAYSLAKEIRNVKHLFLSGCETPDIKRFVGKETQYLSENELLTRVVSISKSNRIFLKFSQIRDNFLPIIKADFIALDTYKLELPAHQLNCNITLLNGIDDTRINNRKILWNNYTIGNVKSYKFSGDHFYLFKPSNSDKICSIINNDLEEYELLSD